MSPDPNTGDGAAARSPDVDEALRLSEEKFATVFRLSPDAVTLNRLSDGLYLEANGRAFRRLLGYTSAEVLGKTSLELGIWDSADDRTRFVDALEHAGEVHNFEARFRRKDGSLVIALESARVIEVDGERCVLSVTRDITTRKKTEEAVVRSEARYRLLADNMADVLWVLNLETGAWDFMSPSVERLLGYPLADVIRISRTCSPPVRVRP